MRRSGAYGVHLQAHAVKRHTMAMLMRAQDFLTANTTVPARGIAN